MMSAYLTACAYRFCSIRCALVAQGVENDVKPPKSPTVTHMRHGESNPSQAEKIRTSADNAQPSIFTTSIAKPSVTAVFFVIASTHLISHARASAPTPPQSAMTSNVIPA